MSGQPENRVIEWVARVRRVTEAAESDFRGLSAEQLNWKPGAERWSVGECLDHLLEANRSYFPSFERLAQGERLGSFWHRLPGLPAIWGSLLRRSVAPTAPRKMKAPKLFLPARSELDHGIVERFVVQQDELIALLEALDGLDLDGTIMPSPPVPWISYSLADALEIVVGHEERHLLQAQRVIEAQGFPT